MKNVPNQTEPLISIIVPVYNVEEYLEECLCSLINQTYVNLEIIIINDGSTDDSYSICKKIAGVDNRISLYSQNNQGLSCARNVGIGKMHGVFFTFVDSDDYLEENFIERLYLSIIKWNCDIAICGTTYVWPTRKVKYEPQKTCVVSSNDILKMFILKNNGIIQSAWGKLYNTRIAKNLHFPEGKLYEDQFVMYHIVAKSRCCVVSGTTYYYRQGRIGSILNEKNNIEKKIIDSWESLFNLEELFNNQDSSLKKYWELKKGIGCLDVVRYCFMGKINHAIFHYALNEIKNINLFDLKRLGMDWQTWLQIVVLKYSPKFYNMLLTLKCKIE